MYFFCQHGNKCPKRWRYHHHHECGCLAQGELELEPEKSSFISHLGHLEGEQPHLGDLLSIVANYLRVLG